MKVRKGQIFTFQARGWDVFDRKSNTLTNGTKVRVCRPNGCPPPNTMGPPGLCARPYFNRYTDDAIDLCDVLSSFTWRGSDQKPPSNKFFG